MKIKFGIKSLDISIDGDIPGSLLVLLEEGCKVALEEIAAAKAKRAAKDEKAAGAADDNE